MNDTTDKSSAQIAGDTAQAISKDARDVLINWLTNDGFTVTVAKFAAILAITVAITNAITSFTNAYFDLQIVKAEAEAQHKLLEEKNAQNTTEPANKFQ